MFRSGQLYDYSIEIHQYEDESEDEEDVNSDVKSYSNCIRLVQDWRYLLEGEPGFCAYGAYLQELPADHFAEEGVRSWRLFIVSQLKSEKGYWRERMLGAESSLLTCSAPE